MSVVNTILTKVFGSNSERELKKMWPIVELINELEPSIKALSDDALVAKTTEFKARLDKGETLDDILPEVFAVAREASWRVLQMRHFDVQLIGGMVLHHGQIAEMKTGEGKTLVATLPIYLNALTGKGAHVVTVNDYLARRDAEWMGKLYKFLGLSVGIIQHDMTDTERQEAYRCDVTYGTNNEFGFDYLRDNMKFDPSLYVHQLFPKVIKSADGKEVEKLFHFAIVDEVDSILIDEARTPLIISGPAEESTDLYYKVDQIIPKLRRDLDFTVDEKTRTVTLTEDGVPSVEKLLGIDNVYDPDQMHILHHVYQALRAHTLYKRDTDYMIKDNQVVIVDEFTGRLMAGRRWSDGLHQAVEAKEHVKIERENQTLATITFQNYFRMYEKLAGMTGTAETEAAEFEKIYELEVIPVPTNRTLIRHEYADLVYRTEREKLQAIAEEIREMVDARRPVLVGTTSIGKSEKLSQVLKRSGIKHVVLNAKYHQMEAEIVAQAGRPGAVTIATNMAGRGTDILLGGNPEYAARVALKKKKLDPMEVEPEVWEEALEAAKKEAAEAHEEVVEAQGLHILATERHESRRIDNQLRGRAGRQGDPGSSRFFLSLEDDLMRIFGSDRISGLMQKMGMEEGVPIEHKMVTNAIERAQKQVEGQNFSIRKHLLEYDDVMNKQRVAIYRLRRDILDGKEQRDYILELADSILDYLLDQHLAADINIEDWDLDGFRKAVSAQYGFNASALAQIDWDGLNRDEIRDALTKKIHEKYENKETAIGPDLMRTHERIIMLQVVDSQWKDHLYAMDHLKEGIGLRGYGQRDPLMEYKKESFSMFEAMWDRVEEEIVRILFLLQPVREPAFAARPAARPSRLSFNDPAATPSAFEGQSRSAGPRRESQGGVDAAVTTVKRSTAKVGRNAPCPCGSGKKYKKCCGASG
ncbi:MAG: preprotein translocase subunit SecA [Acidobacteriota bacterium]|nr:MAG: preprotein translocase subunit SecA [Acidobacteriota bacterium]